MITTRQLVTYSLIGLGLLLLVSGVTLYPVIAGASQQKAFESQRGIYKPSENTRKVNLPKGACVVTVDTTFFLRGNSGDIVIEVNFGQEYLTTYNMSEPSDINYYVVNQDAIVRPRGPRILESMSFIDYYKKEFSSDFNPAYHLPEIYTKLQSGEIKLNLGISSSAPFELKKGRGGDLVTPSLISYIINEPDLTKIN